MTKSELEARTRGIAPVITKKISASEQRIAKAMLEAMEAVTAPLAARLAKLEAQPKGISYRGAWDNSLAYEPNDVVTQQGSMWIALRHNAGCRPQDSHEHWRLCVKAGRDAR